MWGTIYSQQLNNKTKRLVELFKDKSHLENLQTHSSGEYGLRERFDFIIKENSIGLINKERNFVEIKECLQLTPQLQEAFNVLSQTKFNIRIGTVRLRVSSHNQISKYGLWLDFSNNDIKNLLVEKNTLIDLSKNFFIEVGQKKKCLDSATFDQQQIKLSEPKKQHWFHTYNYKTNTIIHLNSAVSSFTQPSSTTAKLITDIIAQWMKSETNRTIWEFGSGIGQYTFPLLSLGHKLVVFENDDFALDCLNTTAHENNLEKLLTIHAGDFQRFTHITEADSPDIVLVNPPKSGLKNFSASVVNVMPQKIIYVSCYPESLSEDADVFLKHNYKITKTHIVDQFPQTHHFEVVMLFERVNS